MVNGLTILKSIHVLSAAFWVGGGFLLNIAMLLAGRSGEPATMLQTFRFVHVVATRIFIPLALIVLGTGIWMTSEYYDWDILWINLGLGGVLLSLATIVFYLNPRLGRAIEGLEQQRPPPPGRNWVPIVGRLNLLLISSILVIMVIRPT